MWLFTVHGMYSVVCAHKADRSPDPDLLMIRARVRDHLDRLRSRFPQLKEYAVDENTGTDYRFRLVVPKAVVAPVVAELVLDLDYSNFKSRAHKEFDKRDDGGYAGMLHRVWSEHNVMQYKANKPAVVRAGQPTLPFPSRADADLLDRVGEEVEAEYEEATAEDDDGTIGSAVPDHPARDAEVLVISGYRKKGKGKKAKPAWRTECVVWWPDDFEDADEAYEEAVLQGACDRLDPRRYQRTTWAAALASCADVVVYDYKTVVTGPTPDEPDPEDPTRGGLA